MILASSLNLGKTDALVNLADDLDRASVNSGQSR